MKILFKNGTKVRVNQKVANLIANAMKEEKPNHYNTVTLNLKDGDDVILAINLADVSAII